jgi:hypothetical protein
MCALSSTLVLPCCMIGDFTGVCDSAREISLLTVDDGFC